MGGGVGGLRADRDPRARDTIDQQNLQGNIRAGIQVREAMDEGRDLDGHGLPGLPGEQRRHSGRPQPGPKRPPREVRW